MNELKFKIITYLNTQNWQRIGAMLFVGFFAICVAVYFSGDTNNDSLLNSDQASQTESGAITLGTTDNLGINSSNNTSAVALKDPFKIPEKFKALPPAPIITAPTIANNNNSNISNNNNRVGSAEIPKMKLTGIVGSGTTREAIVEVSGKSRSYKKMDMIIGSPYQLIYMTGSAAVFRDSSGEKITLTIGR